MKKYRIDAPRKIRLRDFDPDDTSLARGGKEKTKEKSEKLVARLDELQELLFAGHQHKVLVILQGMDTSGKDGTIEHVMGGFDPIGVRVVSFKKPTSVELDHDYLWRVHAQAPAAGEVVVFNRSHYEDVLVVRVHDLVPKDVWEKRYAQINDFERMLAENGTIILKFFLNISKDEQKERLEARVADPTKRWKFQHGDLEERKLWPEYQKAYEDVLSKTSTEWAPWYVVPANAKWYRNYVVGSVIVDALEGLGMKYPEVELGEVVVE
ncbi:MAG TPA: polyphosphate kinase 2 family protein [Thermoanaerobaculia bacterium]|nr:polyphosphate kinase 2 family protein [Thermoanaerobaculia bacterium]